MAKRFARPSRQRLAAEPGRTVYAASAWSGDYEVPDVGAPCAPSCFALVSLVYDVRNSVCPWVHGSAAQ
jgi:hypothetical protein